jgi:hypothetical protein
MASSLFKKNHQTDVWWLLFLALLTLPLMPKASLAHQTPTTIALLDIDTKSVAVELQIPISELELAFGHGISKDPTALVAQHGQQLKDYLVSHFSAYKRKEKPWRVEVTSLRVDKDSQTTGGPPFWELVTSLTLLPPENESTDGFYLFYDVVMHQVMNHRALVIVRNDPKNGIANGRVEVGTIGWDVKNHVIPPFAIDLRGGTPWKDFKRMFWLGVEHIRTGTDHLLFIITLLLPACFLAVGNKWIAHGGWGFSIIKVLKVASAFTVGHSVTLLIGAAGTSKLPTQAIEVAIAVSILVSAFHALRPIFPGKEMFVAGGSGLIHGLAFSQTLQELQLDRQAVALGVLGFNLGIEAMQAVVISATMPFFMTMSRWQSFKYVKNTIAALVGIAALSWMIQRISNAQNMVSNAVDGLILVSPWTIVLLCALAATLTLVEKMKLLGPPAVKNTHEAR